MPDRISAGGAGRARPALRGAVSRDACTSGEHNVGLPGDRTRARRRRVEQIRASRRSVPQLQVTPVACPRNQLHLQMEVVGFR